MVVKLHEWTQRHVNPEGEIIEVLGRTNEPSAEFKGILRKYNLETTFPEAVMAEAALVPAEVGVKGSQRTAWTFARSRPSPSIRTTPRISMMR